MPDAPRSDPLALVRSWRDEAQRADPAPRWLIDTLAPDPAAAMLYAPAGVGKTWLAMELARALAQGARFLAWEVPRSRRVLYVDGEMTAATIRRRIAFLCGGGVPEGVDLVSLEAAWRARGRALNLAGARDQALVMELVAALARRGRRPDLIIFDNLSSLVRGIDESSNSGLDGVLAWIAALRVHGLSTLQIHHAGKVLDLGQRGASRRTDQLDTVIRLRRARVPRVGAGTAFDLSVEKHRHGSPRPARLRVTLTDDAGRARWEWEALGDDDKPPAPSAGVRRVLAYLAEHAPTSRNALAEALGIDRSNARRWLQAAREMGWVEEGAL
ncbi:MAG: AAA family ATPase, partial [Myxococcales bacterium]|nr:AAA family ATPase [Myxococcales bacterium]